MAKQTAGTQNPLLAENEGLRARLLAAEESLRSEKSLAEGKLAKRDLRFRALVENSADAIALLDARGNALYDSPSAAGMLGYGPEERLGQSIFPLIHPDDLPAIRALWQSVLETPRGNVAGTFRLLHKSGAWLWIEAVATNLLADPSVAAIVVNYRNITDRKQAEERSIAAEQTARELLAKSEQSRHALLSLVEDQKLAKQQVAASDSELRALFASMHDTVFVIDRAGYYRKVAPTNPDVWYIDPQELLGKRFQDVFGAEQSELFGAAIQQVLDTKQTTQIEYELIFPGQSVWYQASVSPMGADSTLWVARDITERKRAAQELRSRTEEVSALYNLSSELATAADLAEVLELVNRQAVGSLHLTFARIALLQGSELVTQAAYPIRVLDHDLLVGDRRPIAALPYCQRALESQESITLRASDLEIGADERGALLLDFAQSVSLIPLRVGHAADAATQNLGLLMLGEARGEEREPFTAEKRRLSQNIADQAAAAIRRMQLRDETSHRLRQIAALHAIDSTITGSTDLHMTLNVIVEQTAAELGVDAASILVLNPHIQILECAAYHGFRTSAIRKAQVRLGESYAGRVAMQRKPVQIPDLSAEPHNTLLTGDLAGEDFACYYGVPLIAKGQLKGVLEVLNRTVLHPDAEWLDFLNALAGQAAIAIDSSTLFEGLQRSNFELSAAYDATIEGWSHALDLRDHETEGHTQRVTEMTARLARACGLSEAELLQVRWGSLLHDIGKMGVPDSILLKPGPLSDEEWVAMKQHPTFAYEMLAPIHYLRRALDIPYCHHEKWDGTGYPRGLRGEQIPLTARVFAVVDVWDALISDRPYRPAWTAEKAREHIRTTSGTHFDPHVVDAFMRLLDEV